MFEIILSNTKQVIPVKTLDEIEQIISRINLGDKVIVCPNGIFNPSYMVAIVYNKAKDRDFIDLKRFGMYESKVSKFAKLLSGKMEMLDAKDRNSAQEEVAAEQRRLKTG